MKLLLLALLYLAAGERFSPIAAQKKGKVTQAPTTQAPISTTNPEGTVNEVPRAEAGKEEELANSPVQNSTILCEKLSAPGVFSIFQPSSEAFRCPGQQVITQIQTANFGVSSSRCSDSSLTFDILCDSPSAPSIVSEKCLGQSGCTLTASTSTFGEPCTPSFGSSLSLLVRMKCDTPSSCETPVAQRQPLSVSCPPSHQISKISAAVTLPPAPSSCAPDSPDCNPTAALAAAESECLGQTTCSLPRLLSIPAKCVNSGQSGLAVQVTCSKLAINQLVKEGSSLSLSCDSGQVIDNVLFASYGTPGLTDGQWTPGRCSLPTSKSTIESACRGKQSCQLEVGNQAFGEDPCSGSKKSLGLQVKCNSPYAYCMSKVKGITSPAANQKLCTCAAKSMQGPPSSSLATTYTACINEGFQQVCNENPAAQGYTQGSNVGNFCSCLGKRMSEFTATLSSNSTSTPNSSAWKADCLRLAADGASKNQNSSSGGGDKGETTQKDAQGSGNSGGGGMSGVSIAMIVIGALVAVGLIAFFVFRFVKRRQEDGDDDEASVYGGRAWGGPTTVKEDPQAGFTVQQTPPSGIVPRSAFPGTSVPENEPVLGSYVPPISVDRDTDVQAAVVAAAAGVTGTTISHNAASAGPAGAAAVSGQANVSSLGHQRELVGAGQPASASSPAPFVAQPPVPYGQGSVSYGQFSESNASVGRGSASLTQSEVTFDGDMSTFRGDSSTFRGDSSMFRSEGARESGRDSSDSIEL